MSMTTVFALSLFFFAATGCAASGPRSAALSESGKPTSTVKPARHDEGRSMNEESRNAVMGRQVSQAPMQFARESSTVGEIFLIV
jgi:hypothetical protein